ncbi:MAG: hypothetical protein HY063_05375 [Bacteroidetes bacterium]|nr:hypothetical protein [Bacteroidota bacterium]
MAATKKSKSTIPTKDAPFMDWLGNYQTQVQSLIGNNAPDGEPWFYPRMVNRWNGVIVPKITALTADWNKVKVKNNRNTSDVKQFNDDKKKFLKETFRPFNKAYVLYHTELTVAQRTSIGILPVADATKTAASQTVQQCFATYKNLGSCVEEFHCTLEEHSTKGGTPQDKVVQMAFMFIANPLAAPSATPNPQPSTPPATPRDCPRQDISTKALFRKDFSEFNMNGTGGTLYIFFRWFDIHHNEKSGPWSIRYAIVMG